MIRSRLSLELSAATEDARLLGGTVGLVTGAASGIGQAIALEAARQGAAVAVADRNQEGMAQTVERIRAAGRCKRWWRTVPVP